MTSHRKQRKVLVGIVAAALVVGSSVAFACGSGGGTTSKLVVNPRPRLVCERHRHRWTCRPGTSTSTTGVNQLTTTSGTLPPPTTTIAPTTTTTHPVGSCVGLPMPNGQADINAAPAGTTFCLSGTHLGWTLAPKSGDRLIGPAVLDGGGNLAHYAIVSNGQPNIWLEGLEVRNYGLLTSQQGAIQAGSGWTEKDLSVHDNGSVGLTEVAGGYGMSLGDHNLVLGGRYFNNRQMGLGGGGATGTVLDGIELDHNDFTDDSYSKVNINCGFEGGGIKWAVATGFTVKNSKVHDNACAGLWSDVYNHDSVITNNDVYGNGGTGIFIEISHGAKISGNNVHDNGFPVGPTDSNPGNFSGWACAYGPWQAAGINVSSSDNVEIWGNTVTNNCAGITGRQDDRGPDPQLDPVLPHLLDHLYVHDNVISGKGFSGEMQSNGANLASRDLVWSNNQFLNGANYCGISC